MSSKELIAEARRRTAEWSDECAYPSDVDMVHRLADALEAAEGLAYRTRDAWQAAEAENERLKKAIKRAKVQRRDNGRRAEAAEAKLEEVTALAYANGKGAEDFPVDRHGLKQALGDNDGDS